MKIAHIINPFKCNKDNSSYLYYAQPITFKSMLQSKKFSQNNVKGLSIDLLAINYEEDDEIIPKNFIKLPNLKRSVMDLYDTNKKLPFINDILQSANTYKEYDYIIYTNSDISVKLNFYKRIYHIIKNNNNNINFIINRRDNIPKFHKKKRLNQNNLKLLYKFKGKKHVGYDCFIIKKELLDKINLEDLFIGYPPWGMVLYQLMKNYSDKNNQIMKVFKDTFLTFHIGTDKPWKSNSDSLFEININNGNRVLENNELDLLPEQFVNHHINNNYKETT